jgi:hypothetical protein
MTVNVRPEVLVRRPCESVAAFMFDPGNDLKWTGGITASTPRAARPPGAVGDSRADSQVARLDIHLRLRRHRAPAGQARRDEGRATLSDDGSLRTAGRASRHHGRDSAGPHPSCRDRSARTSPVTSIGYVPAWKVNGRSPLRMIRTSPGQGCPDHSLRSDRRGCSERSREAQSSTVSPRPLAVGTRLVPTARSLRVVRM